MTVVIDSGLPMSHFEDMVESHANLIDMVKFGWGTALVTKGFERKIKVLEEHGIAFFLGGTLLEKAIHKGCFDDFLSYCDRIGAGWVEVSNGTLNIPLSEKLHIIELTARHFNVISEIGFKDEHRSSHMYPSQWIAGITEELTAGAHYILTEARESGTSGICRSNGELRFGLIDEILTSNVPKGNLIFEAPTQEIQTHLIKSIGQNVNVANIPFKEIINLETLRQGLRFDTFFYT